MMVEEFTGDGWEDVEVDYFAGPLHEEQLDALRDTRDAMNRLVRTYTGTEPRVGMVRRVWIERQEWQEVDPFEEPEPAQAADLGFDEDLPTVALTRAEVELAATTAGIDLQEP